MELEGCANGGSHRARRLMQRNKMYAVTTLAQVAIELGEDEDFLFDLTDQMETEDSVIWVYGTEDQRPSSGYPKTVSTACATSLQNINAVNTDLGRGSYRMRTHRPKSQDNLLERLGSRDL